MRVYGEFAMWPCLAFSLSFATRARAQHVTTTDQHSGTSAQLIAVSPVSRSIVWISGAEGTVVRTTDGGVSWTAMRVPGADSLQFRDIHAVDNKTAYIMSAGTASSSRIYKTVDAGRTWTQQYALPGPGGFFDCMDFWDAEHGIVFSDSYEGSFQVVTTWDGGAHWDPIDDAALPPATEGEGGFAAGGTCLRTIGNSTVVIGTGAGAGARLLRSDDRGVTWRSFETPIAHGKPTSGISSLSFLDDLHGFAFGLDLSGDDDAIVNVAQTVDGGRTWSVKNSPRLPDVYASALLPTANGSVLLVTGPKGIDYSTDSGDHWFALSDVDHWGIGFADSQNGWAVGPSGRITKLTIPPQ